MQILRARSVEIGMIVPPIVYPELWIYLDGVGHPGHLSMGVDRAGVVCRVGRQGGDRSSRATLMFYYRMLLIL